MEVREPVGVPSSLPKNGTKPDPISPAELKKAKLEEERMGRGAEFANLLNEVGETRLNTSKALESVRSRLEEIAVSLNEEMQFKERKLNFSVDEISNRILFSVMDEESGEVIKQIPPEAILKVAHNLEALKGVLFDDRY